MRFSKSFQITNTKSFIKKALNWATDFNNVAYFNPNDIAFPQFPFRHMLAVSDIDSVVIKSFDDLRSQHNSSPSWLIGHLNYDLKNQIEDLKSQNPDRVEFEEIHFFIPQHLIFFGDKIVQIVSDRQPSELYTFICSTDQHTPESDTSVDIIANTTKDEYIETVKKLRDHIIAGDIYEINYCMEFFSTQVNLNPVSFYTNLIERSPSPFSCFYKTGKKYALCSSPERFIKKTGNQLISQPIKGTIRRGATRELDHKLMLQLKHDEKERAENMMIVDLVRNDLAKSCLPGTVKVEEMFGIYSFRQLHQMISTISGTIKESVHFADALKNAFPMGSMTGAPKIKVMELIEMYEEAKRGLYSGSIGYINPDGDFDFNVVIRSLLYNSDTATLSFQVGSAITFDSVPEKEYEECLLKAKAIIELLKQK